MIAAGKYTARVADYGVRVGETGRPSLVVRFQVDTESVFWRGFFTEKTMEITTKALHAMGMKTDQLDLLAEGPSSGVLNQDLDISIVVEHEERDGKKYAFVRWVNEPSIGGIKNCVSRVEATQLFAGISFAAKARVDDIPF
jgi:hypothetical protein